MTWKQYVEKIAQGVQKLLNGKKMLDFYIKYLSSLRSAFQLVWMHELDSCLKSKVSHKKLQLWIDRSNIYWYFLKNFFKQANDGPCFVSKPGMFDFQGKKKWYVTKFPYLTEFNLIIAHLSD